MKKGSEEEEKREEEQRESEEVGMDEVFEESPQSAA